jgi:choline dehydrogenase-like flavoprotein
MMTRFLPRGFGPTASARTEQEHAAEIVIVAVGAIESARLLLLSSSDRHPDGLKLGGHVGRHLTFHQSRIRETARLWRRMNDIAVTWWVGQSRGPKRLILE